jgi:hypothetical protein
MEGRELPGVAALRSCLAARRRTRSDRSARDLLARSAVRAAPRQA